MQNSGLYTTVYDTKGKTTNQIQRTLSVTKAATLGDKNSILLVIIILVQIMVG